MPLLVGDLEAGNVQFDYSKAPVLAVVAIALPAGKYCLLLHLYRFSFGSSRSWWRWGPCMCVHSAIHLLWCQDRRLCGAAERSPSTLTLFAPQTVAPPANEGLSTSLLFAMSPSTTSLLPSPPTYIL